MKTVLAGNEADEGSDEGPPDPETLEDRIVADMQSRGRMTNASAFAFTATPKPKTLELFGCPKEAGGFKPFSLYPMRQAIEEGFILDVLRNYTTYKDYWRLLKTVEDDPKYDRGKADYLLKRFVDENPATIARKVAVIVEHFQQNAAHCIDRRAKAMVVTRSRLTAVRYRREIDKYLKEHRIGFKALVAFSGEVEDGRKETEASMNGFPEAQTVDKFDTDEYRMLVVAQKFQTGFDQPLLNTMYVDRLLGGVHAVQTLSRLNRVHADKQETMVLDFANEAETVRDAFLPYYDRTYLREGTDPNLLYDYEARLRAHGQFSDGDLESFAEAAWGDKPSQEKLHGALAPVVEGCEELDEDEREGLRGDLRSYIRLYAFLSQIVPFTDGDLERLYVFSRYLLRLLPAPVVELPTDVIDAIDLDSYRVQKTFTGPMPLEPGGGELEPREPTDGRGGGDENEEALSEIIKNLNDKFATDFTEADRVLIERLEEKLAEDSSLSQSASVSPPENVRLTFDHVVNEHLQGMLNTHFNFYKKVNDNSALQSHLLGWLFDRYQHRQEGAS